MWYNTKYDWTMLMALQRDGDMGKFIKDNDAFGYIYMRMPDSAVDASEQSGWGFAGGRLCMCKR